MVALVPAVVLIALGATSADESFGIKLVILGMVLAYVIQIWNKGIRQGRTGSSIGKGVLGIAVVRENNGRYLGVGLGLARWLVYYIFGSLCLLDYLWPLWDARNQTWHDMVIGSVVIRRSAA